MDDAITVREQDYGRLVNVLRKKGECSCVKDDLISEFLTHMEIRTKSLRLRLKSCVGRLLERMIEKISQEGVIEEVVTKTLNQTPKLLEDKVVQNLVNMGLPDDESIRAIASLHIEKYAGPLVAQVAKPLRVYLISNANRLINSSEPEVDVGILKGLSKSIAPQFRIKKYERFDYRVIKASSSLICADFAPLLVLEDGRTKVTWDKEDNVRGVMFAISHDLLLVGGRVGEDDILGYNHSCASKCVEFFVSNTDSHLSLCKRISTEDEVLSNSDLERIIEEAFINFSVK